MHASRSKTLSVALLDPYCELGHLVCRLLAIEGYRPVVISADPVRGEVFSTRMALEGFSIPHRLVCPDIVNSEQRAADDLQAVFGGLRGMLSFFTVGSSVRSWFSLPLRAAEQIMQRETSRRIRLLRAVAPLLRGRGFMQNILMTSAADTFRDRLSGAAAGFWDEVLADEWDREGVVVRRTVASVCAKTPVSVEARRIFDDFSRLMILTGN